MYLQQFNDIDIIIKYIKLESTRLNLDNVSMF